MAKGELVSTGVAAKRADAASTAGWCPAPGQSRARIQKIHRSRPGGGSNGSRDGQDALRPGDAGGSWWMPHRSHSRYPAAGGDAGWMCSNEDAQH